MAKEKIKEKINEVVEDVKEEVAELKEIIAEKVEEVIPTPVKEALSKSSDKKQTWWNRIISAIVGAIVAAAATYGITATHISEQNERVTNIKELSSEALTALKAGDFETAKAALELVNAEGKELAASSKEVIDNIKKNN